MKTLPAHVAIVGCGFTGTSALHQLVERYPVKKITVFEVRGEFGPGYPYGPDESSSYLLNNSTDTLGVSPRHRTGFRTWLASRANGTDVDPKSHLPRREFGAFLADVVRATLTLAAVKGIAVELVPAEVTSLREPPGGGVELRWREGRRLVDAAILATGRCPDVDRHAPPAGASVRHFPTHIGRDDLDVLPNDATCHVLGASLSAYDVINRLFAPATGARFERDAAGVLRFVGGANRRSVVLCSRSGRLKKFQSVLRMPIHRTRLVPEVLRGLAHRDELTLAALLRLVREEAVQHAVDIDWKQVLDPYAGCTDAEALNRRAAELLASDLRDAMIGGGRNFLVDLADDAQLLAWDAFAAGWLAPGEERLFRDQVESAWLCYSAPCPPATGERLLALHRAGRLTVRAGVRDVELVPDGRAYRIRHAFGVEEATVLIDATGAVDRDVRSPRQPHLIASLREQGLLRPHLVDGHAAPGADIDLHNFRLPGTRAVHVANMLLWGPGLFTSSAFMMATIVERLLQAMFATVPEPLTVLSGRAD